jgi:S-adenosylmethionine synthetase
LFGVEDPLSLQVESFGTGKVPDKKLAEIVRREFDLSTPGIIETLNLRRVKYAPCACYGAFGRTDVDLPWEKTDRVDTLKAAL